MTILKLDQGGCDCGELDRPELARELELCLLTAGYHCVITAVADLLSFDVAEKICTRCRLGQLTIIPALALLESCHARQKTHRD